MYVIVVYDVSVDRVAKVCNFLRRYLTRVQNSVFEGEITDKQFAEIQYGLKQIIEKDADSVRWYSFRTQDQVKVTNLGIEKADLCNII
jgi:CRISPR-associated protein Cas2